MIKKLITMAGKAVMEISVSGLIVGGAILIYENIFIKGCEIGTILRMNKKAVKNNG